MPVNPEDEDDVVPDMHAAFGINQALGQGGGAANGTVGSGGVGGAMGHGETSNAGFSREAVWRDLGMEGILDGGGEQRARMRGGWGAAVVGGMAGGERGGSVNGVDRGGRGVTGARREGRRTGILLLR